MDTNCLKLLHILYAGPNTLDVTYEDIPIPQSPVKVNATPGHDSSRVRAYGPGLEGGITEAPQVFTVDVKVGIVEFVL